MEDNSKYFNFVRNGLFNGFSVQRLFERAVMKFRLTQIPPSLQILAFNKKGNINGEAFGKIPEDAENFLRLIRLKCKPFRYTLEVRECPSSDCQWIFMSHRYAVDVGKGRDDKSLTVHVYDCLYLRKRKIRFNLIFLDPTNVTPLRVFKLTDNQLLIVVLRRSYYAVHLFELDFDTMSGKCQKEITLRGSFSNCIVDSTNRNRFFLLSKIDGILFVRQAYAQGGTVYFEYGLTEINLKSVFENNATARPYFKLEGNQLRAIVIRNKSSKTKMHSITLVINKNEVDLIEKFSFNSNYLTKLKQKNNIWEMQSVWSGQKCFMLCRTKSRNVSIFVVDVQNRIITGIENEYWKQCRLNYGQVTNFFIEDGALSVGYHNTQTLQHISHKIPLQHPDTLKNICFGVFCKKAVFMDDKHRKLLIEKLPIDCRPFCNI